MFIFTNPNPTGKLTGDCVIRAISIALNATWEQTYMDLCLKGLSMCDLPNANSVWGAHLKEKGFERYAIPNTCPDCYTIRDFAIDNPTGTYVLATGTHIVSVIDGDIYDSWDSSNEIPTFYFHKEDK